MRASFRPAGNLKKGLFALALFPALLVGNAHADGDRPWPAEWPIVLPPLEGRGLPRLPPPGPPDPPATVASQRVLEVIARIRTNLRETRYQHRLVVHENRGIYRWDCSLMAGWILQRAVPRSMRQLDRLATRPLAEHFVRTFERAPTDRFRDGWQQIADIRDVRAGDVFAWRRPPGFPSRNTGHVGFFLETPRRVAGLRNGWAARVADSTSGGHQDDSRPWPGEGGFGTGVLVFLTDEAGRGTHYGWAGTYSSGYVVTPIWFGRVGP